MRARVLGASREVADGTLANRRLGPADREAGGF